MTGLIKLKQNTAISKHFTKPTYVYTRTTSGTIFSADVCCVWRSGYFSIQTWCIPLETFASKNWLLQSPLLIIIWQEIYMYVCLEKLSRISAKFLIRRFIFIWCQFFCLRKKTAKLIRTNGVFFLFDKGVSTFRFASDLILLVLSRFLFYTLIKNNSEKSIIRNLEHLCATSVDLQRLNSGLLQL